MKILRTFAALKSIYIKYKTNEKNTDYHVNNHRNRIL
jgi:hypothetical protein